MTEIRTMDLETKDLATERVGQVEELFESVVAVLEQARTKTYRSVNMTMVNAYWEIGKHIVESQSGLARAEYGAALIPELSAKLTEEYGRGFTVTNLKYMRRFYLLFPIRHTLCDELTWSHYRALLRVDDEGARNWYEREAAQQGWSVRTLDRNISTQYYHRLLCSSGDGLASEEGPAGPSVASVPDDKLEFIKNPVVAEFLGLAPNAGIHESQLEEAIISNLQKFLLEMGKGYAFVARQQHVRTELNVKIWKLR